MGIAKTYLLLARWRDARRPRAALRINVGAHTHTPHLASAGQRVVALLARQATSGNGIPLCWLCAGASGVTDAVPLRQGRPVAHTFSSGGGDATNARGHPPPPTAILDRFDARMKRRQTFYRQAVTSGGSISSTTWPFQWRGPSTWRDTAIVSCHIRYLRKQLVIDVTYSRRPAWDGAYTHYRISMPLKEAVDNVQALNWKTAGRPQHTSDDSARCRVEGDAPYACG